VCSKAVISGVVTDTFDAAMLLLYTAVVFNNIILEFDTVIVVVLDDAVAVILRLRDVLDTAIGVAVAFLFPNCAVPIIVLKNVVDLKNVDCVVNDVLFAVLFVHILLVGVASMLFE
jgi:hypothetical protein